MTLALRKSLQRTLRGKRSSAAKKREDIPLFGGEDEATNALLGRRHSKKTLRRSKLSTLLRHHSSKYDTARGGSVLWTEDDEDAFQVKVFIRDTCVLNNSEKWQELIEKGTTNLVIEDNDNNLKDIPEDIGRIQTLRSFTLMWSKVNAIPSHVAKVKLKEFCLQKCPLKNANNVHLIRDLEVLELKGDGLKTIPMQIGEMTTLVRLNLSGNRLSSLPVSVANLQILRELNLCGNQLSEISESITDITQLVILDVSQNHIADVPTEIGKLTKLTTLRLSHNKIKELPQSFKQITRLRHLFLGYNNFHEVPEVVRDLPELKTLNMVSNQVSAMHCPMERLNTLLLDKNRLQELPLPIFDCFRLEKLSVQYNKLKNIPPQIARLDRLRALYLGGNDFDRIPDDICMLSELRHLVIRETNVKQLPRYFDRLHCLSVIDIEETELDGQYQYAAKKEGVAGVMEQVKLKRSLSGEGKPEAKTGYDSDRGSSVFDSEDEPATDNELLDDGRQPASQLLRKERTKRCEVHTVDFEDKTAIGDGVLDDDRPSPAAVPSAGAAALDLIRKKRIERNKVRTIDFDARPISLFPDDDGVEEPVASM